ncbi:ABC transporter ATP-binding protein [Effusibacillus pohliae]|uniref:ABC transporter ATP-binding protein n=1 Tax=Effusibacillus pohliae TaxID=232270 RepID=UPI0003790042|nr:ABC transporter ATP-binding protein [Effusibacillus pohliae]
MLRVEGIHTYHGYLHVLKGVDFHVRQGEIFAIVGSNGAGKSTLMGSLAGVYPPRTGSILFEGERISGDSVESIVRKGICLVPERRQIFDSLSVRENLLLGAYHRYRNEKRQVLADLERVLAIFPKLQELLDRPGGLLSGGEQQMLAIGRGMMANPKLILLDEPSLGLAPLIVKSIMGVLKQLRDELGVTVILVEQNVKAVLRIADRACVLERGEIVLAGTAAELMNNPDVQAAYLGKGKKAI